MTADEAYTKAYKAQYQKGQNEEAFRLYLAVLRDYPNSRESSYAVQQLENLKRILDFDAISIDQSLKPVLAKLLENWNLKRERAEKAEREKIESAQRKEEEEKHAQNLIVTTGDLKRDYEVIGPVYYQISNKGIFNSDISVKKKQYREELNAQKRNGQMSDYQTDWGFLYGEWSVGQNDFDAAFYIAVQELKKRAARLGADAIICMRQDIDIDTTGFAFFYLQMYGTAVRYV